MRVALPLMKNVLTPLAKNVLMPLGPTAAASAADAATQKKITTMIITNVEDLMEIVKSLEESGL